MLTSFFNPEIKNQRRLGTKNVTPTTPVPVSSRQELKREPEDHCRSGRQGRPRPASPKAPNPLSSSCRPSPAATRLAPRAGAVAQMR